MAKQLALYVVTANTFGRAREALVGIPCELTMLPEDGQDTAKRHYVEALGSARCVCLGNDRMMLKADGLGIAVMQREGAAVNTLLAAQVMVPGINAALGLLLYPQRLVATLRT